MSFCNETLELIKQLTPEQANRYFKAVDEARAKKMAQIAKMQVEWELQNGTCEDKMLQFKYNQVESYKKELEKNSGTFFWITLNFRPDVSLHDIMKTMDRIVKRKEFTHLEYGYDQRGDTDETCGTGIHVHAVLKRISAMQKNQAIKWLHNTCKDLLTKENIHVKQHSMKFYEDKRDYIKGKKFKEDKQLVAEYTAAWRMEKMLYMIYPPDEEAMQNDYDDSQQISEHDEESGSEGNESFPDGTCIKVGATAPSGRLAPGGSPPGSVPKRIDISDINF